MHSEGLDFYDAMLAVKRACRPATAVAHRVTMVYLIHSEEVARSSTKEGQTVMFICVETCASMVIMHECKASAVSQKGVSLCKKNTSQLDETLGYPLL